MALAAHNDVANEAILEHSRAYLSQKRKCLEENAVLRNIVKRAKSDGINTKAMIAACEAGKLDPDEVVRNLRDQARYLSLRKIPVSRESLFDGWDLDVTEKARTAEDIWDIEEAGYRAGRHGMTIEECPYPPGSENFVHWQEWWTKGQAAIARELGPNTEPAPVSRSRPRQTRIPGTEHRQRAPDSSPDNVVTMPDTPKKAGRKQRAAAKKANGARRMRSPAGRKQARPQQGEDGERVY